VLAGQVWAAKMKTIVMLDQQLERKKKNLAGK
jgi:hypothetical protein